MDRCCDDEFEFSASETPWVLQIEVSLDGGQTDITGFEFILIFKKDRWDEDSAAVHEMSYTAPAGPDATAGVAAIVFAGGDQAALPEGIYSLKVEMVTDTPGTFALGVAPFVVTP
ncbi:MAG TPA: hypothetical protein VNX47_05895 [Nevskia sp.]|jgi:hypothetical protein|nr:hypothetical protein [Nevskia sp.]